MAFQLSFDDGPGPSTPALLDVLGKTACAATFFVLGCHLEREPALAERMVREGHRLGNHTWTHARPGGLSAPRLIAEIEATDALICRAWQAAGRPAPVDIPLRLPYGIVEADTRLDVLAGLGRSHVGWTAIFDDWHDPAPSPSTLFEAMRRHLDECAQAGRDALLCLHDSSRHAQARSATVDAVRMLLGSENLL